MKDISMGFTISSLVGATFLQLWVHSTVKHMIETKNIILCNRYKDDITLIPNHTNITA